MRAFESHKNFLFCLCTRFRSCTRFNVQTRLFLYVCVSRGLERLVILCICVSILFRGILRWFYNCQVASHNKTLSTPVLIHPEPYSEIRHKKMRKKEKKNKLLPEWSNQYELLRNRSFQENHRFFQQKILDLGQKFFPVPFEFF